MIKKELTFKQVFGGLALDGLPLPDNKDGVKELCAQFAGLVDLLNLEGQEKQQLVQFVKNGQGVQFKSAQESLEAATKVAKRSPEMAQEVKAIIKTVKLPEHQAA